MREDITRNIVRNIVSIGKEPDRDIDYLVHGEKEHDFFARRLQQKLHLHHAAKSTVMVARNPAFRQKAPGIRGGVWGEAPRFFFIFFYFFPVKIT